MADTFDPGEFAAFKQAAAPAATPAFDPAEFAASKPQVSGVSDFFRSMPRALVSGFSGAASALGKATSTEMGQDDMAATIPDQPSMRGAIEKNVTGELPLPQGTPGKFGAAIGETLGNPASYLGPGGLLAKIGMGAASAVGSEAAGELAEGTPYETPMRIAGSLIGGPLAARAVKPQLAAAQQMLADRGVTQMTVGQLAGGILKSVEDKATSFPILGDFIQAGRKRSIESFNRSVANQALEPIGETLGRGTAAGHDTISEVHDKLGAAYDNIVPHLELRPDQQWFQDLRQVYDRNVQMLPEQHQQQFSRILTQEFGRPAPLDGEKVKVIESNLNRLAGKFSSSPDANQQLLGEALTSTVAAVRSNMERMNPAYAQELARINSGYAMYVRMRTAAANRRGSEGVFTPGDLLTAIKRGDRSVGKGSFARGDALMQAFAEAGQKVLPSAYPDSGTAGRLMANVVAGSGAAYLDPRILAGTGAASVPYLRPSMYLLGRYAAPTTGPRAAYAAAGRGMAPLLRAAAATPYGFKRGGRVASLIAPTIRSIRKQGGGELDDADQAAMSPETYANPLANAVVRTPEYMARGVGKLIDTAAMAPPPGLRREDMTDIPGSAQPVDPLVGQAFDTAQNVTLGAGAIPAEANALRTGVGLNAKTANMAKFEQFKRLENKDVSPSMNYSMSGWYRGGDGQPRFWVSDKGAKLADGIVTQAPINDGMTIPWAQIPNGSTLEEVWNHPRLFEAYPWLRDMPVEQETKAGQLGHYSPDERSIYVKNGPASDVEDTIHHEVGHAIQHFERFSNGTAPQYPKEYANLKATYQKQETDLHKAVADIGLDPWSARIVANKTTEELSPFERGMRGQIDQAGLTPYLQRLKEGATMISKIEDEAYARYLHTHGESEARDAPYLRRNPSALKRGQIPLHVNPDLTPGRAITMGPVFARGGRVVVNGRIIRA